MKSKKKQRILALLLSMVLMLSASISAMAEGDAQNEASGTETTENQAAAQSLEEETVPETEVPGEENGIAVQSLEGSEEPVQETEESVEEVPAETTVPAEESSQEYVPQPEISDQTGVENIQIPEDAVTVEETPEQEQPEEVISPATELKQEFTDENGNVTQTVTAYLPEGAFQATADQISMEVKLLNEDDTNYIKGMMEEKLPEGFYLDGYVLYQIDFKVNGEITRPAKAITISMTGNNLAVEDTKKAHVFYYVPEDPEVEGDKDQLTEVIQKDQLIQSLEESGQSTENIEDYDYAEIAVNNGNADTVTVKGWDSTIYGCYAEKEMIQEATYEDDTVKVTVSANEKGIIPNKTTLQVVPISNSGDTKEQYKEVEKKLQEKAKEDAYEIAGFLAYDISFVDKDGNEVEPNGEVRVSLEYKEATLPEGLTKKEAKKADVTMLHLEEDGKGEVKDVVDMAEKEQVEAIETTESQQVEKVAVKTESFSTFTITWTYSENSRFQITAHYVYSDENGDIHELEGIEQADVSLENKQILNVGEGSEYVKEISGFKYRYTTVNTANGNHISQIESSSESGWFGSTIYYVKYKRADRNQFSNWLSSESGGQKEGDIYFVYQEIPSDLKIADNIIETGTFDAEYNGNGTIESYQWYRSDTRNGDYTPVEKIDFEGNASNLSGDRSQLYPAYDEGARMWYKVVATLEDGSTVESNPLQVPYFDEVQNGGFETPAYMTTDDRGNRTHETMSQVTNEAYKDAGGVWQSTGEGKGVNIEILGVGKQLEVTTGSRPYEQIEYKDGLQVHYSWQNGQTPCDAEDGDDTAQFAELNCEAEGALYQDVLTMEGTALNYWFSHRARGKDANRTESDTMSVVIMPTNLALTKGDNGGEIDTQEELDEYLSNLTDEQKAELGIYEKEYTSDDQSWHYYEEIGAYTAKASLTRFFFVARETSHGDVTVGNFLDGVGFSQELPPVKADEFTLELKKEFDGLDGASLSLDEVHENLQFRISIKNNSGEELSDERIIELLGTNVISKDNWTEDPYGNITWAAHNKKIGADAPYTITITEENADLSGYDRETSTSVVIRTEDQEGNPTEGNGTTATVNSLGGKQIATVTFQNTYERSEKKNITFNKKWDDAGDKYGTRPGSLEVTLAASITVQDGDGQLTEKPLTADDLGVDDLTRTLTSDNATDPNTWQTVWQDVPVYYEYNGIPIKINYTVTEGSINGGYVYEAANGGVAASGDGSDYEMTVSANLTEPDANTAAVSAKAKALKASAKSARAGETEESVLGEPAHNKYIEYDASTGEYTLNLDVTGEKGEAKGADILFVIDTSGSMADSVSWGGKSYLGTVKDLLTDEGAIIDQIFAGEDNVNSVAYVSFAGKSETKNSGWYSKNNYSQLENSINNLRATGGTNWTYAMQRASSVLSQRSNSDNEKVVIFLSDGEPTYTMSGGMQTGYGNYTTNKYYEDAIDEVTESASLKNAQFYSVYLTSGTQSGMKKFSDGLVDGGVNSQLKDGTDLSTALEEILNQIIPTYENVTITDVLSDYVVFAEENPRVSVKVQNADGSEETLTANSDYTLTKEGKTVKVTFTGDHKELKDGATYTISFKVKPSEEANNIYAKDGYLHKGDPGTGSTSANRDGFYSNDNDATNITYSIKGVDGSDSASYPKPVVQVTTHTLSYEKQWERPDNAQEPTKDVTLKVGYSDGTTKEITLKYDKDYIYTETVPVTKNIASVTEIDTDPDYTPSYQITEGGTKVIITNSYTKIETKKIKVVKVYDESVENPPEVQVALYGSTNDGNAVLLDTQTLNEKNEWTYTWDVTTQSGWSNYSYAVREVNIPAGFKSSISYEYGNEVTTATIKNTYDSNCEDEEYYIANILQTDRVTVNKTWDDNNNVLGKRPEDLNVTVSDGSGKTYTVKLSETNSWYKEIQIPRASGASYTASEILTGEDYEQTNYYSNLHKNGADFYFENTLKSTSVTVKKEWNDGNIDGRPTSIQFKLQYKDSTSGDWNDYGEYTMTKENMGVDGQQWTMVIENLPAEYQYHVVETGVYNGETPVTTYTPNVDETTAEDGTTVFTITNTLKWSLKKTDMPEGEDAAEVLAGAEFALKGSDNQIIAIGTSGEDGMVTWTNQDGGEVDLTLLNGVYKLSETKAPSGYQILKTEWTLEFENGFLKKASGEENYGNYIIREAGAENGVVVTLKNDKLYELPETGGPGIFLYMIGGTLLLMAGSLMIYINRRRGGAEKIGK
mgnify:CR=1 FL=1